MISSTGHRPRGRPQRLPFDATAAGHPTVDGGKRLAWLLATSRLLGPDGTCSRTEFIDRLRASGVKADSSRISRWESGLEALSPALTAAYEKATGTAPGAICSVRQMLVRGGHLSSSTHQRSAVAAPASGELDALMDRVANQTMRGEHWLRVANLLATFDQVYLHPRTWRSTCDLLVDELGRSSGLAYLRRFEAAAALLAAPAARSHVSRSIGRCVLEPGAQIASRVLPLVSENGDPGAGDLLLRMMSSSDPLIATSAARAVSRLITLGRVQPSDPAVHRFLADTAAAGRARGRSLPAVCTDIASHLPDEAFGRYLMAVRGLTDPAAMTLARATSERVGASTGRLVADRVALRAEEAVGRQAHEPDRMLRTLVREALFHVHGHRRSLASAMLLVSPYAPGVCEATIELTHHESPDVARPAAALATRLAGAMRADQVAPRIRSEQRPELRMPLLSCLAQARGPLDEGTASHAAKLLLEDHDPDALAALAVLGMHRRTDLFPTLARPSVDAAVQWWLASEGGIHED